MNASFPEVRFGAVYGTTNLIQTERAEALVKVILASGQAYAHTLKDALQAEKVDIASAKFFHGKPKEKKQHLVINFPKFRFSYNGFGLEGSLSATVCRQWRRSKIWVGLTCLKRGEKKAAGLDLRAVIDFFQQAMDLAETIEKPISKLYHKQARDQGFQVINDRLHELRVRTFNSRNGSSRKLYEDLAGALPLETALKQQKHGEELMDFFQIALCAESVTEREVLEKLRAGNIEFFRYFNERDQDHRTLVAASTTPSRTDLCAYGFTAASTSFQNSTSHMAGVGLARDYGVQF